MSRYSIDPNEHLAAASHAEIEAWLACERAALWAQLTGLDERILCEQPAMEGWTAKDLLAHVAHWDAFFAESVTLALDGRAAEVSDVNLDERNAVVYAERRDWPLAVALDVSANARAGFLKVFGQVPVALLDVEQPFGWGQAAVRRCALWRGYHDRTHAAHLAAWRATLAGGKPAPTSGGSKPILLAALEAQRRALLALFELIPPDERATRPICGVWTLKDVAGHLTDWERLCAEVIGERAAEPADDEDIDAWNAVHAAARRAQPWPAVWADLTATRQDLLSRLSGLDEDALNRPLAGRRDSAYYWAHMFLDHDREHAQDLALLLGIMEKSER